MNSMVVPFTNASSMPVSSFSMPCHQPHGEHPQRCGLPPARQRALGVPAQRRAPCATPERPGERRSQRLEPGALGLQHGRPGALAFQTMVELALVPSADAMPTMRSSGGMCSSGVTGMRYATNAPAAAGRRTGARQQGCSSGPRSACQGRGQPPGASGLGPAVRSCHRSVANRRPCSEERTAAAHPTAGRRRG